MSHGQISTIFIAAPGGVTRALRVTEPDTGRGKRYDHTLDPFPSHPLKPLLGRPPQPSAADEPATRRRNAVTVFGKIEWRHNVVMKVDQARIGALCRVCCHAR